MNAVYVSIAGFYLKIVFEQITESRSPLEFARQKLISEVLYYLSPFIATSMPKKTDAAIYLVDDPYLERVRRKADNKNFISHYYRKGKIKFVTNYQISLTQFTLLLEDVLQELLTNHNGFGIHASSNIVNKRAYLFLGKSGAGKSTISTLLSSRFRVISDDNIIIRKVDGKYFAYQTPFFERNIDIWKAPFPYPLGKVFIIHKGTSMSIKKILSKQHALSLVSKQILGNTTFSEEVSRTLKDFIKGKDVFYDLWFPKDSKELVDFFIENRE